jgi:chromate transport protein ChrA
MAFGGPQAHIAILRDHLVIRRNWIEEKEFMELFAIGQVRIFLGRRLESRRMCLST